MKDNSSLDEAIRAVIAEKGFSWEPLLAPGELGVQLGLFQKYGSANRVDFYIGREVAMGIVQRANEAFADDPKRLKLARMTFPPVVCSTDPVTEYRLSLIE